MWAEKPQPDTGMKITAITIADFQKLARRSGALRHFLPLFTGAETLIRTYLKRTLERTIPAKASAAIAVGSQFS